MIRSLAVRALPLLTLAALALACGGTDAVRSDATETLADAVRTDADGASDAPSADTTLDSASDSSAEARAEAEADDDTPLPPEPTPDVSHPDVAEAEPAPEIVETDGGDADTQNPPLVSACVDCHTDKTLLVALLPEEPPEEADHGGG